MSKLVINILPTSSLKPPPNIIQFCHNEIIHQIPSIFNQIITRNLIILGISVNILWRKCLMTFWEIPYSCGPIHELRQYYWFSISASPISFLNIIHLIHFLLDHPKLHRTQNVSFYLIFLFNIFNILPAKYPDKVLTLHTFPTFQFFGNTEKLRVKYDKNINIHQNTLFLTLSLISSPTFSVFQLFRETQYKQY